MTSELPTTLPGDKLRKAIQLFSELLNSHPESTRQDILDRVAREFDLSPLEEEFLIRQLDSD